MATSLSKSGTNDDNVIFETGTSEVERLNRQHEMIAAAMDPLILAPINLSKPGLRILDQATGAGKRTFLHCVSPTTSRSRRS
jgi:hypothetical protein